MDDNDTSWPTREPGKWRGVDISRASAHLLIDVVNDHTSPNPSDFHALEVAIDDAQGMSQNGEAFLLIRIVDR